MFIGIGSPLFSSSLNFSYQGAEMLDSEFLPTILKNLPFFLTLLGMLLSFFLIFCYETSSFVIFETKIFYRKIYIFLSLKWCFDQLFGKFITHKIMNFGYRFCFQNADKGSIEVFGPSGLSLNLLALSIASSKIHSGYIFHYSFLIFSSAIGLVFLALFFISFNLILPV